MIIIVLLLFRANFQFTREWGKKEKTRFGIAVGVIARAIDKSYCVQMQEVVKEKKKTAFELFDRVKSKSFSFANKTKQKKNNNRAPDLT